MEEIYKETHFGYELLRSSLLPDLFGNDEGELLYWGGRRLARQYPLHTLEELTTFFNEAGWGTLHCTKERKRDLIFQLELEPDEKTPKFDRSLEAGFLAEQIEQMKSAPAEALLTPKRRVIELHISWEA
ncbi:uncharacterized protein DUF2507 [Salsuginibacillus halophilus]|uniref:Uncharacterized protein DUF2507 n=1 Tax=Salsuginibacillus halophilus TaxID=517424 RepID=A0A2P8HCS1_9BACI|nr:DUF2507 domain-containing protein [Salsuginibacillus halophilus]PSL44029.1 uncharacterized protein DUF2507 [Salsuginibacillus halophilus]